MIRTAGHVTASQPSSQRLAPGTMDLKGHGFSRDASATETDAALAAEGMQVVENIPPQELKLRPFKANVFTLRKSIFAVSSFLASAQQAHAGAQFG